MNLHELSEIEDELVALSYDLDIYESEADKLRALARRIAVIIETERLRTEGAV